MLETQSLPPKSSALFRLMKDYKKLLMYTYALSLKMQLNNITDYGKVKQNYFSQAIEPVLSK